VKTHHISNNKNNNSNNNNNNRIIFISVLFHHHHNCSGSQFGVRLTVLPHSAQWRPSRTIATTKATTSSNNNSGELHQLHQTSSNNNSGELHQLHQVTQPLPGEVVCRFRLTGCQTSIHT
jgi:hypothetical protein